MENFVVSARKYRPQTFNTVVGQKHITITLKNAIKNQQLAHAFLFCGPRGVGKTTCARILAKTINCENLQPDGEACDQCSSCQSFNEGASLNVHELDAASNNSVDDIRSLVEQVRFAPQAGKYKVYIVDEVHMLSSSAFNAFLKTLEEPPSYAIFILATTEKHKLLPTILSRCQIFDFKRITNDDTVEHLEEITTKESIHAEKAALQVIAQKCEGCMRDALSILDKIVSFTNGDITYKNTLENLNILDEDYYFKILDSVLSQDLAEAMLLYNEINKKGFEGEIVLNGLAEFFRNLLVAQNEKAASLLDVVEGMQQKYNAYAQKLSPAYIVSALNILNEAEVNYKMARNKRLHVEMAIIKLNFLQQAISLAENDSSVSKKKRIDNSVTIQQRWINNFQIVPVKEDVATLHIESKKEIITPNTTGTVAPEVTKPQTTLAKIVAVKNEVKEPKLEGRTGHELPKPSKQSLLDAIKAKVGRDYEVRMVENPEPLDLEKLKIVWDEFAANLLEQKLYSAANTFKMAKLSILNDDCFKIEVSTLVQKNLIEQERMPLLFDLQKFFKNKQLTFKIEAIINEDEDTAPAPLSSRERFDLMAQKSPALKMLKDKLRLNLDY